MDRSFAIVTTCKARLGHLKRSLPQMLAQGCKEVVVVDYSCPERTAAYVTEHFPAVRVVVVDDPGPYSHSRARNAGAAAASADSLIFCDADTILADQAVRWLSDNLPVSAYGFFELKTSGSFNRAGTRLANNQLRGFHVIPANAFQEIGGYDEFLEGYASGEDIDIERKLALRRLNGFPVSPNIIKKILEHDDNSRIENYCQPIKESYGAGLLYRAAKELLLRLTGKPELEAETRRRLYEESRNAILNVKHSNDHVSIDIMLDRRAVGMPRQLGYERGQKSIILRVELSLENKLIEEN